MLYFMGLALGLGLGVPLAVVGAGVGQGKAAAAALEAMARQPEMQSKLQTTMILSLAFIESLVIFALLMGILAMTHLPETKDVMQQITAGNAK